MKSNPVIRKELKTKMRGWKSAGLVTAYTGFLLLVLFLYFSANNQLSVMTGYGTYGFRPRIALQAYYIIAGVQLFLVLMVIPGMTATAISGERERQTLDLVLCTEYRPLFIVAGKAAASIAHIMLLIMTSLPLMSMMFLFGGIGLGDLFMLFGFYLAAALMVGCMGIFFSSIFKKSAVAVITTYLGLGALVIGPFILVYIWAFATGVVTRGTEPNPAILILFMSPNPLFGFMSTVNYVGGTISIAGIVQSTQGLLSRNIVANYLLNRPWLLNIIFNLVMAAVFILASSWIIRPVKRVKWVHASKKKKSNIR